MSFLGLYVAGPRTKPSDGRAPITRWARARNRRGNAQTDGTGGFHVCDDLRVAGRFDLSLIAASTRLFIVAMSRCALRILTL